MPPLIAYHNDHFGTKLRLEDYAEYELSKTWNCSPAESIERGYSFYRSSYMDKIKPVVGASIGIQYLRQKKHELAIITSRPHFIDGITKRWIEKHFPDQFTAIHHTNQFSHRHETKVKKSTVCRQLGIELILEDHLEYAFDCAEANIKVFLFTMPWNKKENNLHKNITRIHSWRDIKRYL